jgi:hypothetical protein
MKQSLRLVSSFDKKRLNHSIQSQRDSWLIITEINLFNDDLQQIQVKIIERINKTLIFDYFI